MASAGPSSMVFPWPISHPTMEISTGPSMPTMAPRKSRTEVIGLRYCANKKAKGAKKSAAEVRSTYAAGVVEEQKASNERCCRERYDN